MLEEFKYHIDYQLPFLRNGKLLIAISGGVDSVVLAHLCHRLDFDFALAHCNFNLRGEESNADEAFVLELAEHLDVEVFIQNFDTQSYANANKRSIQMAARELRYNWFAELAVQLQFDFVLTAHHADDNLETFLINFTRGTGLNGLTGIPILNDNIARPLLSFSNASIIAYARDNDITWREDSSNASRKYLRNKLRHEVVPILKTINPQLLDSFQNTLENLNDTADIVEESLNAVAKRSIIDIDSTGVSYKVSEFKKVNNAKAYLFGMFSDFGFTQWQDIVDLLDAESGKQVLSHSHRLVKHRETLILTDLPVEAPKTISILSTDTVVEIPTGFLHLSKVDTIITDTKSVIYLDMTTLRFPLAVRVWQEGDTFQPIGMKGKKKVSKYLKDEKLARPVKEQTLVLTSNNTVVWVLGRRADDRFKVTDQTQQILKIALTF